MLQQKWKNIMGEIKKEKRLWGQPKLQPIKEERKQLMGMDTTQLEKITLITN